MQEIIKWVERLVTDELEAANKEFPPFHSKHEAYGVLLEEFREAEAEWKNYCEYVEVIERNTFKDNDELAHAAREVARRHAIYCIAELIQNVAMLDKWTMHDGEAKQ